VEKLEFHKVRFKRKRNVMQIAIEEILDGNRIEVNGVCLFKKPKYEYSLVLPYGTKIKDKLALKKFIQNAKEEIIDSTISDFRDSYGEDFNTEINIPKIEKLKGIRSFLPVGYKKSTYNYIIANIKSEKLKARIEKAKKIQVNKKELRKVVYS
jgi:hypothetical protein